MYFSKKKLVELERSRHLDVMESSDTEGRMKDLEAELEKVNSCRTELFDVVSISM